VKASESVYRKETVMDIIRQRKLLLSAIFVACKMIDWWRKCCWPQLMVYGR